MSFSFHFFCILRKNVCISIAELIANSWDAGAKRVDVFIPEAKDYVPENSEIIIQDDGIGFDVNAVETRAGHGLGLAGMRERMALVGGTLSIESSSGRGTRVVAEVTSDEESKI